MLFFRVKCWYIKEKGELLTETSLIDFVDENQEEFGEMVEHLIKEDQEAFMAAAVKFLAGLASDASMVGKIYRVKQRVLRG
jgi:hypothetical protein